MKRNNWIYYMSSGVILVGFLLTACERSASTAPIETGTPDLLSSLPVIAVQTLTPPLTETPVSSKEATLTTEQAMDVTPELGTGMPEENAPDKTPQANDSPYLGQHTVMNGETLYMIGRAYGVYPDAIAETNKITDPDHISPGIVLNIPKVRWPGGVPPGPTAVQQFEPVF